MRKMEHAPTNSGSTNLTMEFAMSIDDDYYDVAAALKGTPEEKAFDRFSSHTTGLEVEVERLAKENDILKAAFEILKKDG